MHQRLPVYAESLAQSRDLVMEDIAAKLVEIHAMANEEAINEAVSKKVDTKRKIQNQKDNEIERPCPLVDKLPAELHVKIYTATLTYEKPVRVIPWRKRFSSTDDLEAELFKWCASLSPSPFAAPVLRDKSVRLSVGILFVNKLVHKEALRVFFRLNVICCDCAELARMRLQPQIFTHLNRVEVCFENLNQFTTIQGRLNWMSTVSAYALLRLASDAPRLHSILVHVDNLLLTPLHNWFASESQANSWTFPSILEKHAVCGYREVDCFAIGH